MGVYHPTYINGGQYHLADTIRKAYQRSNMVNQIIEHTTLHLIVEIDDMMDVVLLKHQSVVSHPL
ncbi:hypothetical protein Golob_002166, partial [Gossypium lobatum]|nr:hypothetical protein [Gossypium lobatum]